MSASDLPGVSVVAIGRNEASNLEACLQSVRDMDYPPELVELIYVDTGSSDRSVEVAKQCGVRTHVENSAFPTAALARNCGLELAGHDIVHFVDGDMTLDRGYLKQAVPCLGQDGIACVVGRVDERHKSDKFLPRALHYVWESKAPGLVEAPGGGGTFLKSALVEVGGYNPKLPRGEETELGYRLRERGHRILLIDRLMAVHDYGTNSLSGLLAWYVATGLSYGKVLQLPDCTSLRTMRRQAWKTVLQAILLIALVVVLARHWMFLALVPVCVAAYVVARYWDIDGPQYRWKAITYYWLVYAGKPVVAAGIAYCWLRHLLARFPARSGSSSG